MELKGSQTEKNLMTAYLRESGAFNEYSYYAMQAQKEGYKQISNTFNTFAVNEQAHAKVWFSLWHGISNTVENLKDSADLENYERTVMYSEFSKVAKKEGFNDIAKLFNLVADVEGAHEQEYKRLYTELKNKTLYKDKQEVGWKCLNCGHIHYGKQPPESCPVCSHEKTYFIKVEQQ